MKSNVFGRSLKQTHSQHATHRNTKVINIMNAKWDFWIWILPLSLIPLLQTSFPCYLCQRHVCSYILAWYVCYTTSYDVLDVLIKENARIVWHLIIPWKFDISKYKYISLPLSLNVNGLDDVQQSFSPILTHIMQYTQMVCLRHKRNSSWNRHEFSCESASVAACLPASPIPYYLVKNLHIHYISQTPLSKFNFSNQLIHGEVIKIIQCTCL